MGEEQKAQVNEQAEKKEEALEEKKEEEKKAEEPQEIVLKVDMHCEGCAKKVEKCLSRLEGVEKVKADSRSKTVMVKGKTADPVKVCERVQKKTRKRVELLSPIPKPPEEEKKEESQEGKEEKKEEQPKPITVILKVRMHCEACAQVLQKRIKKIEGVESVVTDLANDQIIVEGIVDPAVLVESVQRKTRRPASIVQDEKTEEEKKPEEGEKKEEKKAEGGEQKENEAVEELKKYEYWPLRYQIEYAYPYPPQVFSDENPNACTVM